MQIKTIKIEIGELMCGDLGTIIDCDNRARFLCSFCKEYHTSFTRTKEVTPKELVNLIRTFKYIIKVKQKIN